jgi:hypothetical protein
MVMEDSLKGGALIENPKHPVPPLPPDPGKNICSIYKKYASIAF